MITDDHNLVKNPSRHPLSNAKNLLHELRFHQSELKKFKHEYRLFEQQMENTWEHYADLYDLMPVGYFTLDENGRTLEVNQTGAEMLAVECADVTGKHFSDWITEDDRPLLINYLRQVFQLRSKAIIELKIQRSDGTLHDVRLESTVVENTGKPRICLVVMTLPCESSKTDKIYGLVSYLTDLIAEGIMITDAKKIIRLVNSAFEKKTGYMAGEVIGRTPSILQSGQHDHDFYRRMWDILEKNGEWYGKVWNRHKNGEIHPQWLRICTIRDNRHEVVNYIGIFSGTDLRKDIQKQMLQNMDQYLSR